MNYKSEYLREYNRNKENLISICEEALNLHQQLVNFFSSKNYSEVNLDRYKDFIMETKQSLLEDKFIVSVIGEIKKGKSSLLNVLMRKAEICPTDVLELTARLSVLSYGIDEKAVVILQNGEDKIIKLEEIKDYVGKDGTYVSDTKYIKIYLNNKFLKDSIWLVDTPGVNTTEEDKELITLNWLSRSDAAIFLVTPDELISNSEKKFLVEKVFEENNISSIMVVMNKKDRTESIEELNEQMNYVQRIINDLTGFNLLQVYPVSSKQALKAIKENDHTLFNESGFPEFEEALLNFLVNERGKARLLKRKNKLLNQFLNPLKWELELIKKLNESSLDELYNKLKTFEEEKNTLIEKINFNNKKVLNISYEINEILLKELQVRKKQLIGYIESIFGSNEKIKYNNEQNGYIVNEISKVKIQTKSYILSIMKDKTNKLLEDYRLKTKEFWKIDFHIDLDDIKFQINNLIEYSPVEKSFFRSLWDSIKSFFTGKDYTETEPVIYKTRLLNEVNNYFNKLKQFFNEYINKYYNILVSEINSDINNSLNTIKSNIKSSLDLNKKLEKEINNINNQIDELNKQIFNIEQKLINLDL